MCLKLFTLIDAQPLKKERTEEEKIRRHLFGDKGARFGNGRQVSFGRDGIMNTITSVYSKDNLVMEMIQNQEQVLFKKERTSKERPKGKGWQEVITEDGRKAWMRIRKLTPRECFRLMGVSEEDIDKIQAAGISDSQQYRMAGNSIVVPVLEGIFHNMFTKEEVESMTLF